MEKKANTRFILFSILWIIIWQVIIKVLSFVGTIVMLILDPGAASPMTMIYKYGVPLTIVGCLATAFVVWGAGCFGLKSVRKHFPDLEQTTSLKKTAKIFYWILAGLGIAISAFMLTTAAFILFCYTFVDMPRGLIISFVIIMLLTAATYTAVPLVMLSYCRKRIDKLYNNYI